MSVVLSVANVKFKKEEIGVVGMMELLKFIPIAADILEPRP